MKEPQKISFREFLKRKWRVYAIGILSWLLLVYIKVNPAVQPSSARYTDAYFDSLVYGSGALLLLAAVYEYLTRDYRE